MFIILVRFVKVDIIMTQNIQNYDGQNQIYSNYATKIQPQRIQQQAVRIPEFYIDDNKKSIKETLEESPIYTMVIKGFFGPLIDHPIASVLTWFGCGFLLNKYDSACSGKYEDSLLKKVTNLGDNIENSKFVKSKPVQKILGFFKSGNKKISNTLGKNSVFKAIQETPTMPELEMVKYEMLSQRQRVVHDFVKITSDLKLEGDGFAKLNILDITKAEKEQLKKYFNVSNLSEIPENKASGFIQLNRIGKDSGFISKALANPDGGVAATKSEILKAMGNKDAQWLKAVKEDTIGKYVNEVQEAAKKLGNKVRISPGNYRPFGLNLGILTTPTKRIIGCDNVYNRLYSLDASKTGGAKTATGRFMSKCMQMVHRGLTFGGGKLGILLFIAPALVETAIATNKAENNQKIGTAVSSMTNHVSWVATFPLALWIMHHIFGAQYAGLSKTQVQKIRDLQTAFNKKNDLNGTPDGFKNYEEYNTERKKVNAKIKEYKVVKGQKWYTRAVRKLAGFMTPDLGKLDAYNTGNAITRKFSQMRNLPRNLLGVPLRLVAFGLLTMGVLDGAINKTIKFCFGESYDTMKEEEQKDAKKEQKNFLKEDLNDRLYQAQRNKIMANVRQQKPNNASLPNNEMTNSISHKGSASAAVNMNYRAIDKAENIDNYTYIPSQKNVITGKPFNTKQDNYTYIPSQNSTISTDKNGNTNPNKQRTYIPSQQGANITKNWDNSGLQSALDRADRAENRALKIIAGNFEGM